MSSISLGIFSPKKKKKNSWWQPITQFFPFSQKHLYPLTQAVVKHQLRIQIGWNIDELVINTNLNTFPNFCGESWKLFSDSMLLTIKSGAILPKTQGFAKLKLWRRQVYYNGEKFQCILYMFYIMLAFCYLKKSKHLPFILLLQKNFL